MKSQRRWFSAAARFKALAGGRRRKAKLRSLGAGIRGCIFETLEQRAMLATSPNIVLVMTDDQRLDTMFAMPITQQLIGGTGTTFENAYTVTSFCCPSRSSMLTGQYVHNHGTVGNDEPQGGFEVFDDSSTLATWLQDAGYRTGLYGKYLNGYYETSPRNADPNNMYVPPGWDEWHAFLGSSFYNFDISANGVYTQYPGANYSTDVLANLASDFIETGEANDDQPFFLFYSVKAPHTPANPAQRHNSEFDDIEPYRPPSFNEADVSDKPAYVRNQASLTAEDIATIDQFRENQLESLLAVDEAVGQLVETLQANGEWDNTIFIFMSDSGIQWGEHRWDVKGTAYEETIRIPMIIRDGRDPVQRTSDPFALNIDIAPTLLEYAGISVSDHIDGESLVPLIKGQDPAWRNDFIVEHLNIGSQPTSIALRSGDWSYTEYSNGERELYDLATDPYQMQSLHNNPAYASIMSQLSVRLHELKSQDTQAPQITNLTVTPNITNEGSITIKATVSDLNTGGSEVRMPTFHIDSLGGIPQGFSMYPDDGLFDSVTENVTAVLSPEAFAALSVGTHTIYVRGRDTAANWSTAVTATFIKTAEAPTQSYVSVSPLSIAHPEGNTGFVEYQYILTRTGVVTGTSNVDYVVSGNGSSPANNDDFGGSFPVGTVTFAPGETTKSLILLVAGDTVPELDETFQVVFSNPSVNTNLQTTAVGGIIQNDETLASTQGLKAEYFNDVALTEFVSTRTDSTVNFTSGWNGGPPGTGVTADQNYSVRWSGEVEIAAGGAWTFFTTTNDGVRVWIDDQLVIDDWNVHIALENSAAVNLTTGWHRIRMEYFQQGGGAVATLSFAGPGQTKAIIPQSRLRTASIPEPVAPVLAITAASASKVEGNTDFTPYTFTVTRSENTTGAITVDYMVTEAGLVPADPVDFGGSFPSGTLAFAPGETSKTITILVSGDAVLEGDETFVVVLLNASGDAEISTESATGTIVNDDAAPVPMQSGLQGEYFNSINLTNLATTRVDQAINFTTGWNSTPPGTTVTGDANYSVRWTGEVEVAASGSWTFFTTSNDGIRLWIDDQLVIDNWTQHAATENSGTVNLSAGWHSIRLEYFQQGGAAVATLSFQGPDQAKAIIPQERLRTPLLPVALTHTMVVGGVTDTAAKVWFRTESEAQVVIEYSTSPDFTTSQQSTLLLTQLASDFTGIVSLAGLSAETKYYYRPVVNGVVPEGAAVQSFTTFAPAGAVREFSFAIFADFENAGTFPTVAAPAYQAAAEDNPAFVLNIGDFDHRNPQSLTQLRNMHRQMRGTTAAGVDFAENIASSYPFFYVWDDHDFGTDDADKSLPSKSAALQAYNEYFPSADRPNPSGVWQELSYGQVDVFMLDVRSQADPRLEADGPDKSMLDGDNIENGQLDWLKQGLLDSTATWKILTSGVSFNPSTKPYDAWGAYGRERQELLDFIDANGITGVVIISGDLHTGGAIDNGTNSTLPELSVPHTNLPTNQQASGLLGNWTSVTPGSAGGGYGWVTISPEGLTLEARDAEGNVRQQLLVPTPTTPSAVLSVEATSASKAEGNSDLTPYTFTVTRSLAASEATTVDYAIAGSGTSAANAADFGGTLPTGTVTFEAGETTTVITIFVSGDTAFEADESFSVTLSNASGDATITGATATGVILNDDASAPATEPGLKGEYFNSTDLTNIATTRVDQAINFTTGWNSTPPGTTVTGDANYSVRWTGQVETPTAGSWTFFTTSNDGIRLWIDDQLVIDNWTAHIATENSGTLNLAAGWHSIRLEYFQQGGAAVATLSFQGPDQSKVLVPTSHLRTATESAPPTPTGDGLEGQYYNSTDLTGLVSTRVDSTVNFTTGWNASPTGSGVTADAQYSVRWTGYVETSSAGDWTFFTTSNDGVRLWINDQLVINNWTTHAATENSGTVSLGAGWHSIRLEYFQQGGAAVITLSYQGPGQTKAIIPQSRLSSTLPGAPTVLQVLSYTGEEQTDQPYVAQASSEPGSSTPIDSLLLESSADQALLAELRRTRASRRESLRLIEPDQAFDAVFAELGEDIFGPLWID